MSSLYATQLSGALPDDIPPASAAAARESVGAAVQVSGSFDITNAAREAFVHAMSTASIVVALVAALGAVIAWRYLPARGVDQLSEVNAATGTDGVLATANS